VKWENDSLIFPVTAGSNGTFEMLIENLEERNYEFTVYTRDEEMNHSVIQTCKGKAIGDIFKGAQLSRRITGYNLSGAFFSAQWADKAESEYVAKTLFHYETNEGEMTEVTVLPDDPSTVLYNWKAGGAVEITSFIVTGDLGFDTIPLDPVEARLPEDAVFQLDKSFFKAVHLTKDTDGTGYGGVVAGMWDGVKGSAQNSRYHSHDGEGVPHTVTFDLGVISDLRRFQITGREDYHNWNPKRFQLWGCESVEGKDTQLPADHADWEEEMTEKGWKLLIETNAPSPHENNYELDPEKTKSVRYIRYRPLEVVGPPVNGRGAYGCVQEVTFWGENIMAVD
jgi:hypothetical protein